VALERSAQDTAPDARLALGHLRRCVFRRMSAVERGTKPLYLVECLYPDRIVPIPLGDLETSALICESCEALHIFRADED